MESAAAGAVRIDAVIPHRLLAFGREVEERGGDEVRGFENLEVAFGGVVALGAVDDGLGRFVPGDFLERERMAQEVLRKPFAALMVTGADPLVIGGVDIEAGVFPLQEVGELRRADEPGFAEGVEEAMAEEFDGGSELLGGHAVEGAVGGEKAVGGEDVEVGVEDEVVAEGVDGGDGSEFALGEVEADAEVIAEAFGGGAEQDGEVRAAFAEDVAEDLGDGEDELTVGDIVADGAGDPIAGASDAALMARGAEVAGLAGEGEKTLVAAVGALKSGEAGGEIAAAEEGLDGGDGLRAQRTEGLAVAGFVLGEKVVPAVMDELPEGRGTGTAGLVDGGHKECS